MFRPFDRTKETLLFPIRPDIEDERLVIDRNEIFVQQSVHDPVSDACYGNLPFLVIGHDERTISAVPVATVRDIGMERRKIHLKRTLERIDIT